MQQRRCSTKRLCDGHDSRALTGPTTHARPLRERICTDQPEHRTALHATPPEHTCTGDSAKLGLAHRQQPRAIDAVRDEIRLVIFSCCTMRAHGAGHVHVVRNVDQTRVCIYARAAAYSVRGVVTALIRRWARLSAEQHGVAQHSTAWRSTAKQSTARHCAAQQSKSQHGVARHGWMSARGPKPQVCGFSGNPKTRRGCGRCCTHVAPALRCLRQGRLCCAR